MTRREHPLAWRPAAVLWDLDGTLVDTQAYWHAAECDLADRYGGTWSAEDSVILHGFDLLDAARYIRQHMGINLPPELIVDDLLDGVVWRIEEDIPWRPGVLRLLGELRDANLACGLVTMSYRRFVDPIRAALPEGTFATVVTGDSVARGKPHPDPYLQAAELLGVEARDCLAIEDSLTGATSASSAGCRVLIVPSHAAVPLARGWVGEASLAHLSLAHVLHLTGPGRSRTDL